jgi:hypothetical protein
VTARDCPHPEKQAFVTKARAKTSLKRLRSVKDRNEFRAYRCPCGYFHLGHKRHRRLPDAP